MNSKDWAPNQHVETSRPSTHTNTKREFIELELAHALESGDLTTFGWDAGLLVVGLHGPVGLGAAEQIIVTNRFKRRIESSMRPWDWMRRLDHNVWAILIKRVTGWREACDIAEMTLSILEIPVSIADKSIPPEVSVGVGLVASAEQDPRELLETVWRAMEEARDSPRGLMRAW